MRFRSFWHPRDQVLAAIEDDRRHGRRASSDQVATCLLRRDLPGAVAVRRVDRVARNRRRVRLVAALLVIWWLSGKAMLLAAPAQNGDIVLGLQRAVGLRDAVGIKDNIDAESQQAQS